MSWLLIVIIILLVIGGGWWGWGLLAAMFGIKNITKKSEAQAKIIQLMHSFDILPSEVEQAFLHPEATPAVPPCRNTGDIAKTLFSYLGAIFILAGMSTYIGMFWDKMGSVMRIVVTLDVGYSLLIVLIAALHENKYPKLILPLTLASTLMMTSGWFVFIHEVFPHGDNWRLAVLSVFGLMAAHQGLLFRKYQMTVLAFTALFFVYGFLQTGLDLLDVPLGLSALILGASLFLVATALEKTAQQVLAEPAFLISTFWLNAGIFDLVATAASANWAALLTGICIMSAAYGLQKTERQPRLTGLGYLLGSIMAYSALFDLVYKTSVELLYFAVTVSMLYACVILQTRALLLTTVIAMLGYIGYFTAQYFVDSLGWPITLILMGVAFFGVGTLAIKVKRYI